MDKHRVHLLPQEKSVAAHENMAPSSKTARMSAFQAGDGGFNSPRGYSIYREWKPNNRVGKQASTIEAN